MVDLSVPKSVDLSLLHFSLSQQEHLLQQKNVLTYLQDLKPMRFILQCHEKNSSNCTVNRPYTTAESC